MISKVIGHIEENNGNKYLIFDSIDENKELLQKYKDIWNRIKNKFQIIKEVSKNMVKILQKLNLILMMICH